MKSVLRLLIFCHVGSRVRGMWFGLCVVGILCLLLPPPIFSAREPRNEKEFYKRGYQRLDKEDWDGAAADFSRCIELNPENYDAFGNRGRARFSLEIMLEHAPTLIGLSSLIQKNMDSGSTVGSSGLLQVNIGQLFQT